MPSMAPPYTNFLGGPVFWGQVSGVTAFDATNVVLTALAAKEKSQTLKQAILSQGLFIGVQSEIRFDKMGDAKRETYMTTIHNGQFLRVH